VHVISFSYFIVLSILAFVHRGDSPTFNVYLVAIAFVPWMKLLLTYFFRFVDVLLVSYCPPKKEKEKPRNSE
jgi:Na+-transporting methylmalonyl-CoA/oxaloacetate decarboxylase gamma subunit